MFTDQRGLPVSAANGAAVEAFDRTVAAYLRFGRDTGPRIKATLEADPDIVLGHCLKGSFFLLMAMPALVPKAVQELETAQARAGAATWREQTHVAALAAWCAGDTAGAIRAWEAILLDHPRDIVALKLAQFHHFYSGDALHLRDCAARVLPAWDAAVPGYGYVLGMRAFGLEEAGDHAAAERAGREAVEADPQDAWAVHAVAHVMEMQDRQREGIAWIGALEPHWSACNNFRYHLAWHRALMQLDLGRLDETLALYDRDLWDPASDEYLDLCNDASLLLRLEIAGIDVGARWDALAEKVRGRIDEHILTFIDLHFMMILAGAGADAEARAMLESVRAHRDSGTQAHVLAGVGLPLCEAMLAWRQRDFARAVGLLEPLRYRLYRVGGSHAQRDVFTQLLIDCAIRAGKLSLARALLAERVALRPGNLTGWRRYAGVLERLGDAAGAARAQTQAAQILNA